ncbi:HdeD family acid-resistance protein [Ruegeria profundi]|uniref:HdeD family acid-resistance protein n=1 Tax=Ruegeria profundi TaxID=1685378 RepID=UPI001CD4FE96|nr:DUF308 domain-containing protein [Ruegeria profundi]
MLVLACVLALIYPLTTNVALAVFLGWKLLFSSIVQAATLIGRSKTPDFWLQLISAAMSAIVGFVLLRNPACRDCRKRYVRTTPEASSNHRAITEVRSKFG